MEVESVTSEAGFSRSAVLEAGVEVTLSELSIEVKAGHVISDRSKWRLLIGFGW